MDHKKIKELLYFYHDGELTAEQQKIVEEHLSACPECRHELADIGKFEEVMDKMELKQPPKEVWQEYASSVYNRLERRIGWIFLSIGAMILLFFGGYTLVESIISDPSTPLVLKLGILAFMGGVAVLLVSLGREQIFVRQRERYKEIEK